MAGSLAREVAQEGGGREDDAEKVDVDHPAPVRQGRVSDHSDRSDTRIGAHQMNRAEPLQRLVSQTIERGGVGYVQWHAVYIGACGRQRGSCFVERGRLDVADYHLGAGRAEPLSHRPPDP